MTSLVSPPSPVTSSSSIPIAQSVSSSGFQLVDAYVFPTATPTHLVPLKGTHYSMEKVATLPSLVSSQPQPRQPQHDEQKRNEPAAGRERSSNNVSATLPLQKANDASSKIDLPLSYRPRSPIRVPLHSGSGSTIAYPGTIISLASPMRHYDSSSLLDMFGTTSYQFIPGVMNTSYSSSSSSSSFSSNLYNRPASPIRRQLSSHGFAHNDIGPRGCSQSITSKYAII
jgi:hypothetical protein